ncbi:MAG: MMPL family transporter, partial [Planctomycetes bacterium]|nr:MMPL family transporter [Planctomycetota bacterium]
VMILVPLAVGLVWSLGLWPVLGFKINVVSITALPLILGLGIDYGVYIFHRIVQDGEARMEGAMISCGKAVFLSAATTIIGFGSLLASVHQGFFDLGLLVSTGITLCYLAGVLLIPALMAFFWFPGERRRAERHAAEEKERESRRIEKPR